MDSNVYRIEKSDGSVMWSFSNQIASDEAISYQCTLDEFYGFDGEVTKEEIKGLLQETLVRLSVALEPHKPTLDEPDKISHTNALQIIQNFEDSVFNAADAKITKEEAENIFQYLTSEMFSMHLNGVKLEGYLKIVREEMAIEKAPSDQDTERD